MNITESKAYSFTFQFEGITFNFNIGASCQQEAVEKLHRGLTAICGELKAESVRSQSQAN